MQIRQKGFTLIELILVIVIIGILAAVAIPRFVDLESDARESSIQGLLGAVKSASLLAHAKYLAEGNPSVIQMEGVNVNLVNGYPASGNGGIGAAVDIDTIDYTFNSGSPSTFRITGYNDAGCQVTYEEPSAPNTSPAIGYDISNC